MCMQLASSNQYLFASIHKADDNIKDANDGHGLLPNCHFDQFCAPCIQGILAAFTSSSIAASSGTRSPFQNLSSPSAIYKNNNVICITRNSKQNLDYHRQ